MQDTDAMVKRNGGKPPLTMQSFTKLVDKAGDPPAALVTPSIIPPPGPVVEAWGSPLEVPSLQEVGFTGTPTTIFKVCGDIQQTSCWLCDDFGNAARRYAGRRDDLHRLPFLSMWKRLAAVAL